MSRSPRTPGRWARYRDRVRGLTPQLAEPDGRIAGFAHLIRGVAMLALLDLNAAAIHRFAHVPLGWWDAADFPWLRDLEARVPEIRAEVEAYLARRIVPSTADVNGLRGEGTGAAGEAVPGGVGMWRVLLLQSFGRVITANAEHFPATMAAIAGTPARANIGFSCMDAGSRIGLHRDPNAGALRVHLALIVPEGGGCRITVDGTEVAWEEGRSLVFHLNALHETCNLSDGPRVLLVMEIPMPLPFPLSVLNRCTQWAYRMLPTYREMTDRAEGLARDPGYDVEVGPDADQDVDEGPTRAAEPIASAQAPVGGSRRATLVDPHLQRDLEEFGFTVVPMLDPGELAAVRQVYAELGPAPDDPQLALNWSFHSQSSGYKHAVKERLQQVCGAALERSLADHEAYLTTFITKWPGENGTFAPHQDPSLVDERTYRGVTVWIPLEDTGVVDGHDNGMLHVVPGSHRFSRSLRVSDVDRFEFAEHEQAILGGHGVGVPTRAGEALVFDNRAIHYSLPNRTDEPRVVASFGVRPREARCTLLRSRPPDLIDLFEIHDDFYIDVLPTDYHRWQPPDPPVATLRATWESWTSAEFAAMCEGVPPAPRTVPASSAPVPADVDPGAFCARCGSSEGLSSQDRVGRNNAQLICPSCQERLGRSGAGRPSITA